jgi:small GTP-binding protein
LESQSNGSWARGPAYLIERNMDLAEYDKNKFAIAEILRSASACLPEKRDEWRPRLADLFARLAEDRFNLVVIGRFNRGKTSLMNAILGTDRLPTDIVPLTSVITTVAYGSKERVVLKYQNSILDSEVPIESLPQYITQRGNPGNVRSIKTAEIQLPAEILRRGFFFVDTPGLGSVIVENTLTTEAFLPEADAFVLVTSYESPFSEEEIRFFKASSSSGKKIFVVLNKHDTVSPELRETALNFVRGQLTKLFGHMTPPIFSVSSTDALKAKRSQDQKLLDTSGISEFEKRLLNFLLNEKNSNLLLRMCDRVREFLYALPRSSEIERLILRIEALRQQASNRDEAFSKATISAPISAFSNLHELPSCEICNQIWEKVWAFLCKYQYQIIVSQDEQQRFAERGGFCPFHAWQFQAVASPYGICAGHAPLLEGLAVAVADSAALSGLPQIRKRLQSLLPNEHDCVLCGARDHAERDAIDATARWLQRGRGRALTALSAICLPHFVMLISVVEDSELVRALLKRQSKVLQRYAEDMQRYAMKHDAVRRYLATQEETTAAERGLLAMVGRQNVNFTPERSFESVRQEAEVVTSRGKFQ